MAVNPRRRSSLPVARLDYLYKRLWRAADRVVQTHLRKLVDEGKVKATPGVARSTPTTADVEAEEEHQRRIEFIKQADEYRAHIARQALVRQEMGTSAEWVEPPLYDLSR